MLRKLKKEGISILVSTPYMDEAGQCDRIALIQDGRFLKIDTPQNMVSDFGGDLWAVQSDAMSRLLTDLRKHAAIDSCFAFGENHHITLGDKLLSMNSLQEYLIGLGHTNIHIKAIPANIEDCFMRLSENTRS